VRRSLRARSGGHEWLEGRESAERLLADFSDLARLGVGLALPVTLQGVIFDSIMALASEAADSTGRPRERSTIATLRAREFTRLAAFDLQEIEVRTGLHLAVETILKAAEALARMGPQDRARLQGKLAVGQAITHLLNLSAVRMRLDIARVAALLERGNVAVDVPVLSAPAGSGDGDLDGLPGVTYPMGSTGKPPELGAPSMMPPLPSEENRAVPGSPVARESRRRVGSRGHSDRGWSSGAIPLL